MRVFGIDSYRDEDDDGGLAKVRSYNAYIDSIRPGLPASVSSLIDVGVHDSSVVEWAETGDVFELTFVTENITEGVRKISLRFTEATAVANDGEAVASLRLTDGSTELLSSEFESLADGRFLYQIMMTPTGELAITFAGVAIERSPATKAEHRELANRPDTGRWGREADTWLDDLPALHRAAALGKVDEVTRLLQDGNPVDEVDQDTGWTPLHAAAMRIQLTIMELLLRSGANIDTINASGQTPLALAARDHDWRGVEFLVKAGADVNLGDDEQPLAVAASAGNTESMKLLILRGADPNQVDSDGWSALMFATEKDLQLPLEILLAAGADPAQVSRDGRSAVNIARDRGQLELERLLDERPAR